MTRAANLAEAAGSGFAFRNRIINGDMRIDQRNAGASITINSYLAAFPVDRFGINKGNGYSNPGTQAAAQQVSDAPSGFQKSIKYTSGTTETPGTGAYSNIQQYVEGYNISDFGWGASGALPVTLSFWVKISNTGTFGICLRSADASQSYPASFTYSSANVWQYVTLVIPGPTTGGVTAFPVTNGTGFAVFWDLGVASNLSASATGSWQNANLLGVSGTTKINSFTGATYQITGVQLEKGTTATPFESRQYATELALCQRYYEQTPTLSNYIYARTTAAIHNSYILGCYWVVQKRVSPTVVLYSRNGTANKVSSIATGLDVGSSVAPNNTSITGFHVGVDSGGGFAVSSGYEFNYTASAEL